MGWPFFVAKCRQFASPLLLIMLLLSLFRKVEQLLRMPVVFFCFGTLGTSVGSHASYNIDEELFHRPGPVRDQTGKLRDLAKLLASKLACRWRWIRDVWLLPMRAAGRICD